MGYVDRQGKLAICGRLSREAFAVNAPDAYLFTSQRLVQRTPVLIVPAGHRPALSGATSSMMLSVVVVFDWIWSLFRRNRRKWGDCAVTSYVPAGNSTSNAPSPSTITFFSTLLFLTITHEPKILAYCQSTTTPFSIPVAGRVSGVCCASATATPQTIIKIADAWAFKIRLSLTLETAIGIEPMNKGLADVSSPYSPSVTMSR